MFAIFAVNNVIYTIDLKNYIMIRKISLIVFVLALSLSGCQWGVKQAKVADQGVDPSRAEVIEVIYTTSYTYLNVEKNSQELWIAVDKQEFLPGDFVYFDDGLEMKNFESPELGRTFETVYFVSGISKEPLGQADPHAGMMGDQPQRPVMDKKEVKVEPVEGGTSIGELFANRDEFAGKIVKVRGQVTKVNSGIMGRNWVHLQDGTADGDNFDLTITTEDEPQVGDVVTYSGTLNLEVDFGYGYYYEVIVEDATVLEQR
jgi:hypothetical protein